MTELPDPLTPPDCDLRGFAFMPMDTIRLLDSDLFALSTGDEFKAALALWCKSWSQVPAGSLPVDDRILAHLSGAGAGWRKVKEMALRNWITCADGRLYHPVVAEKAMEAWDRREEWTEKQDTRNERQRRWRERQKQLSEKLRELGIAPPKGASLETLERLLDDATVDARVDSKASTTPSTRVSTVDAGEMPKTGTGTGTIPPNPRNASSADPFPGVSPQVRKVLEAGLFASVPPDTELIDRWLALPNMELERDIIPMVERMAGECMATKGAPPFRLKFFDGRIRERHAQDEREIERLRAVQRRYGSDQPGASQ